MKKFTSCFVGISLPDKFLSEFQDLLKEINKKYPEFNTADPKTPHITVFYLDEQSQFNFPKIEEDLKTKVSLLKEIEIEVGGLDFFGGDLMKNADQIVWMNTPKFNSVYRILRRYTLNFLKGKEKHGFWNTMKFAFGSMGQHDNRRTELTPEDGMISPLIIENTLEPYKEKLIRIKNNRDLRSYLSKFN